MWTDIAHINTDRPMANRILFAKFQVSSSFRSDAIVTIMDERKDGPIDIAQMSKNFALIIGFQVT